MTEFDKDTFKDQLGTGESSQHRTKSVPSSFLGVAQGFRQRTLATTKLSAKLGINVAQRALKSKLSSALGVNRFTADLEQAMSVAEASLNMETADPAARAKAEQLVAEAVAKAWDLFGEMDQLKGLVMKFGQMASYLNTHMPPEAQRVLAKLQAEASALPFDQVQSVIKSELGRSIDDIFEDFEPKALAAASIGQVHKAAWQGHSVVVKVQYPGVDQAIDSDLNLIGKIKPFAAMYRRLFGASMNTDEILRELVDRVQEECDYQQEAHQQNTAKAVWQHDSSIVIPKAFESASSRRVLVSEYIEGETFYSFKDRADQEELDAAAHTLFRMSYGSIFKHCFLNGDPHPGNYLFLGGSQVAFLDYGCVVRFELQFVQGWKRMIRTVLEDEKEQFKQATRELGFVGNENKFDWDFHWHMYQYFLLPFTSDGKFTFSKTYSDYGDELLLYNNKNTAAIKMPRSMLFVTRLQWGFKNILMDMKASIDTKDEFYKLVYGDEQTVFDT